MSKWFVSRHPGAIAWAREHVADIEHWCSHLEIDQLAAGDVVCGTLPVPIVADLNERGVEYLHLVLELSAEQRGTELSADTMKVIGARLEPFQVVRG